jgi:hypothetical protein
MPDMYVCVALIITKGDCSPSKFKELYKEESKFKRFMEPKVKELSRLYDVHVQKTKEGFINHLKDIYKKYENQIIFEDDDDVPEEDKWTITSHIEEVYEEYISLFDNGYWIATFELPYNTENITKETMIHYPEFFEMDTENFKLVIFDDDRAYQED